jgi:xanthine dehydrogenase YagR molybdenum-binding subunit
VLSRRGQAEISAKAVTGRLFGRSQYGRCAFGAQFVKLRVHPETGEIQLQRFIGAFGAGRIVNPKLARSQLLGGMVWGAGQALWEETVLDERVGRWVNSNLAEALVPTNSDIPQTEALLVEENDRQGSSLGVKGIGELGITGVAAAIANAAYHATGRRVRELPLRLNRTW